MVAQGTPERILLVRNDKLGDFLLALPSFRAAKAMFPQAAIVALVPEYTAPIARLSSDIDEIVIDPGRDSGFIKWRELVSCLRKRRFDAVVTLFSTGRIGAAVWTARIPYRLAPATKVAQVFYNHKLVQRRSRSEQPEYRYNLDLIRQLGKDFAREFLEREAPYLSFDRGEVQPVRAQLTTRFGIGDDQKIVLLHPGHGGSANNLSPEQYAALANRLLKDEGAYVLVTAGPGELSIADNVVARIDGSRRAVFESAHGLVEFAKLLAVADVFVGGSTGPLHIAGALDTPTAAFYPRGRVTSALRWQTLNSPARRLAFFPPEGADADDMARIDLAAAADEIRRTYLSGTPG